MLDIIIPTYKNKEGLYRTIFSFGTQEREKYHITIVDDCSGENYDDLVDFFSPFHQIDVLYLNKNCGPGLARQYGLDNTNGEFIFFIDTGDVMNNPHSLNYGLKLMEENPNKVMLCPCHQEEFEDFYFETIGNIHNRIHGKIYRRDFLNKYNIRFNEKCPRANEDIGFNELIRLICEELYMQTGEDLLLQIEDSLTIWTDDKTSLVRRNQEAFMYKEQNYGMAVNCVHAFEEAKKLGVRNSIIDNFGYNIFCASYCYYLGTLHVRPEFERDSFKGALYLYENWFKKLPKIDEELLLKNYNDNMAEAYNCNFPLTVKIPNFTFLQYLQLLEKESQKI